LTRGGAIFPTAGAELDDEDEIDAFGAEMVDRFGPLLDEVQHLLDTVVIKAVCRRANVAKIEAGRKGRWCRCGTTALPFPKG
jgi:transcription-repair coupling factor (superfamily II helicase)